MQRLKFNFGLRYSLLAMSALGLWLMPAHAQQRPAETRARVPVRGQRARTVLDPVAVKEAELNERGNPLGEPTADAQPTADGRGRFRVYRNGFIYWSPETGAHAVYGDIGLKWADMGRERSPLGYPLTDELDDPVRGGGRCNDFQHGMIRWTPEHGAMVLVEQNTGIRVLEPPSSPPAPPAHDEQATTRTILPDGAVETRYPDGRIVRRTDGSITTIYPDGRRRTVAFVSGQEPSPPLSPADSSELRNWRERHAESLLNIIKQLTSNDEGAVNNLLSLESSENMSPYKSINLRARVIVRLLGR